jgi:hypothetical protein
MARQEDTSMRLLALALLALPVAAHAQVAPLTAEQSGSLDKAIALLTNGLVSTPAGQPPTYTVTPQGDHYALSLPLPHAIGDKGATLQGGFSADLQQLPNGTWSFQHLHGPFPISINTPQPGRPPLSIAMDAKDQVGQATLDPTLTTASSIDQTTGAVTITTAGMPSGGFNATITGTTLHNDWTPIAGGPAQGRVDAAGSLTLTGFAEDLTAGGRQVKIGSGTLQSQIRAAGLSPSGLLRLNQALLHLDLPTPPMPGMAPPAPGAAPGAAPATLPSPRMPPLTPDQRQRLHRLLDLARDVAHGVEGTTTLSGVAMQADDVHFGFTKLIVGAGGTPAADGRADLHLRLEVDGPFASAIPPAMAGYVPSRVVLAPRLSGVPIDVLFDFLGQSIDGGKPTPEQLDSLATGLFAKGPVSLSFDQFAVDLGPSSLTATGAMQVAAPTPQGITGSADLVMKGYDALLQRLQSDPAIKAAVPMLIFAKGIGQQQPDGTVLWKVSYADDKVLVNGADLSTLMPH